jgi:hypothetical protein
MPGRDSEISGQRFSYRLYGLNVASDFHLEELEDDPKVTAHDLEIRRARIEGWDQESPYVATLDEGQQFLSWSTVGAFRIRGGKRIDIEPASEASLKLLGLPLLGPVLAVALAARGNLVLHASAVLLDGRAALFLGDKGSGKSTTAAAALEAGGILVTDDVAALDMSDGRMRVATGFGRLKLKQGAARPDIPLASPVMPRDPRVPKHEVSVPTPELPTSVAGGAFVLERGERLAVERLDPISALAALSRYSYLRRFGGTPLSRTMAAAHQELCAAFVRTTPVVRLIVPNNIEAVPAAVALARRVLANGV